MAQIQISARPVAGLLGWKEELSGPGLSGRPDCGTAALLDAAAADAAGDAAAGRACAPRMYPSS